MSHLNNGSDLSAHPPRSLVDKWTANIKPVAILALAATFALLSGDAVYAQDGEAECPVRIDAPEVEGLTVVCGQIMVPQNWSNPDGTHIPISYMILKSTSVAPLPDPVIFFQGGPGGATLSSSALISAGTSALRASRDVIMFDQRGTGFSNELFCPVDLMITDVDAYEDADGTREARFNAFGLDAFSDPATAYRMIAELDGPVDRSLCLPYFAEQGIELEHYSTASTVQDTIAVMKHLGYPSYNLFGGSYGTTVVLSVLDHYTRSSGSDLPAIRAAVLDSVHPLSMEFYEQAFDYALVVLGVFDACAENAACAAAYPDIRARMGQLLAALQDQPREREGGDPITADAVAEILRTAVSSQKALLPYLPRLVAELEGGETAVFDLAMSVSRHEVTLPDVAQNASPAAEPTAFEEAQAEIEGIRAQLDAVEEAVTLALGANAFLREAALEADGRADLIVHLFEDWTRTGGSLGNTFFEKVEPYVLHPEQRTSEGLAALIRETVFFPSLQSEMLAIAERLDENEVRQVFKTLTSVSFDTGLMMLDHITNRVVNCNDRGPRISNDLAYANYLDFEVPQLIGIGAQWPANYQITCEELGLAAEAYEAPPPPVASDVRTLVIGGMLDTPTPSVRGERTAEALGNATFVEIPMANHTPGLMTDCGRALVHAFILSPDVDPNLACVEAARPSFVMPDDELPE